MLTHYLKSIHKYKPLSRAEEVEVLTKARAGDMAAYNQFLNANLKFAVTVAKQYQGQGLSLEELIAEANVGLVKAYSKFDLDKGFKFITYAVWWIRQAILNAIHNNSKIIRLPLNKIVNVTKASRATARLEQKLSRIPTYAELDEYLDDSKVLQDIGFSYTVIGLNNTIDGVDKDLNDVIAAEPTSKELQVQRERFLEEFHEAIKGFTEREQTIVCMYYGIANIRPYTLKEIGIEMCLTRERVRQIKKKVIDTLTKRHRKSDTLRSFL